MADSVGMATILGERFSSAELIRVSKYKREKSGSCERNVKDVEKVKRKLFGGAEEGTRAYAELKLEEEASRLEAHYEFNFIKEEPSGESRKFDWTPVLPPGGRQSKISDYYLGKRKKADSAILKEKRKPSPQMDSLPSLPQ